MDTLKCGFCPDDMCNKYLEKNLSRCTFALQIYETLKRVRWPSFRVKRTVKGQAVIIISLLDNITYIFEFCNPWNSVSSDLLDLVICLKNNHDVLLPKPLRVKKQPKDSTTSSKTLSGHFLLFLTFTLSFFQRRFTGKNVTTEQGIQRKRNK